MSIYPYRAQAVRDLAWACFSPPMIDIRALADSRNRADNCRFELTDERREWLEALDRDSAPLMRHLAKLQSRRLGLYFEALWHFFLSSDADSELVASNIPVRENGRTLGEFDCIYFCRQRNRHVHLELAAKFYLGWRQPGASPTNSQWSDWYGPNTRDRLDIKINHLLDHQIKLGELAAARDVLNKLGVDRLEREIALKGYLFTHYRDALPPPPGFAAGQQLPRWARIGEMPSALSQSKSHVYLELPRLHWLSTAQLTSQDAVVERENLLKYLRDTLQVTARPRLIAGLDDTGAEIERFFVTDRTWPSL